MSRETAFVRKIVANDMDLLFIWVNDPEVRLNSIKTDPILYEEHQRWFKNRISSADCSIYILEVESTPAGQVRFEYDATEKGWIIDFSVAKDFRGNKLGKRLLEDGLRLFDRYPVIGYVKEENQKSQNVFDSLGFTNEGIFMSNNCPLVKYRKSSSE